MKKYNWEEDRFYSISEDEERLYSTGDNELDDLLEKAFCEGYEYAQREFAAKRTQDDIDNLKRMKDADILAEKRAKGLKNRGYNQQLKYAKYQAQRREKKDWSQNMVNRDGYSY